MALFVMTIVGGFDFRKILKNNNLGFCISGTNFTYLHARTVEVKTC